MFDVGISISSSGIQLKVKYVLSLSLNWKQLRTVSLTTILCTGLSAVSNRGRHPPRVHRQESEHFCHSPAGEAGGQKSQWSPARPLH
jgi:hypothetical protein